MSGTNSTPQPAMALSGNPDLALSQGSGISNTSPFTMPSQGNMSNPNQLPQADEQTNQMIANYRRMQDSGAFNTPYQNWQQQHPVQSRISNALLAMGQSLTGAPTYTDTQGNRAQLQNTQMQGMNQINAMPAQLRMMMAMQGMQPNHAIPPTNIPGVQPQMPRAMSTPSGGFDWTKVEGYDPDKGINYNPAKQKMQVNSQGSYRIVTK